MADSYILTSCIRNGQPGTLKRRLVEGADPNALDGDGDLPLIMAVRYSNMTILKTLLEHKADVNRKDRPGNTALLIALRSKRPLFVEALLEAGADMDVKDSLNKTPWDYARDAAVTHPELLRALEKAHARRNPAPEQQERLRQAARHTKFRPPRP